MKHGLHWTATQFPLHRVSPSTTLLVAIDGPAAAAKVAEQRRRRRARLRMEKGPENCKGGTEFVGWAWWYPWCFDGDFEENDATRCDRILLQTLHKNALMKHSNVKGRSEGRSIVTPSWLLVAAVLWHRKGGIWSSAFTRHRDMAMILGTCVSSNQSCLVESIVSCWWQFVIDIIVQVRHRTEYFLAKDAQQEASTQLRLDPWQGSWAFGHGEIPALRNYKYQMNWLATIVISTNRPMKLNQNGTWFTVQVVRDVGVHSGKSQQDRSLAGSAFGRARGGDCREGQRLAVEHHDIEFQLRAGTCWDRCSSKIRLVEAACG